MIKLLTAVLLFAILFFIAQAWFASKGICVSYDKEFQKITRCFKIGKGQ